MSPSRFAIIGGTGKMGQWVGRFLAGEGNEVVLIGRDQARLAEAGQCLNLEVSTDLAAVTGADAVILSIPPHAFAELLPRLARHVNPNQLIFDITSVKARPVELMHRCLPQALVLGTHPVFGPGARSLEGHHVVLTPTNPAEEALARQAEAFLAAHGARVSLMTPEEHDRAMAVVLGLAHFISIVSGDTLAALGFTGNPSVSGISFRVLKTLVESVLSEDPALYASLQASLPDLPPMERFFTEKAAEWAALVAEGKQAEFARRMAELKERFQRDDPEFGQAYDRMYRIAED